MSVHLDEDEFRGYLQRITVAATEAERTIAADELIVELHRRDALRLWGRHLALHFGRADDWEEFASVITEALLRHVRALTAEDLARVQTVGSYLYFRGKGAVQMWLDSPAVTFAKEMSGMSRRHRTARAAMREMTADLGREPQPAEVVEYVNAKALATRKDAVKQGALITAEDVVGAQLRALSMDYSGGDSGLNDAFGTPHDGSVTVRAEAALTVAQLARRAVDMFGEEAGAQVRLTLELWVGLVLAQEPVTATAVSRHFGVNRRVALERLARVDEVMRAFREARDEG